MLPAVSSHSVISTTKLKCKPWIEISKVCLIFALYLFTSGIIAGATSALPIEASIALIAAGILLILPIILRIETISMVQAVASKSTQANIYGTNVVDSRKVDIGMFKEKIRSIQLQGKGHFTICKGEENSIQMRWDDNLLDEISWRFQNGNLELLLIVFDRIKMCRPLQCIITLKNPFTELNVSGSVEVNCSVWDTKKDFYCEVHDNCSVEIHGQCNHLSLCSYERGKCDGEKASCESAEITILGQGSIHSIRAARRPKITIKYTGQATCTYILPDSQPEESVLVYRSSY